jgi:hypothetical protein
MTSDGSNGPFSRGPAVLVGTGDSSWFVGLVEVRTDGLKLSLKPSHTGALQLDYQQLMTEAPVVYVLVVLSHQHRGGVYFNVTESPNAE